MFPRFRLGKLVITLNARDALLPIDVLKCILRHARADWGEVCDEDRAANDDALSIGGRVLSVYRDRHGIRFWIITEADRSTTTILLPEDY